MTSTTAYVELPLGALIEYREFCRALGEALYPTGETGLEGVACVTGKMITRAVQFPASVDRTQSPLLHGWQSVLISEDALLSSVSQDVSDNGQAALPLEDASPILIGDLALPYELSEGDRDELSALLPQQPSLRYPMSEEAATAFLQAYNALPDRPNWQPILVNDTTIYNRKVEQEAIVEHHRKALRQEIEAGRLTPVDANHAPVKALMAGIFIPRVQAIAYLERHGLAQSDDTSGHSRRGAPKGRRKASSDTTPRPNSDAAEPMTGDSTATTTRSAEPAHIQAVTPSPRDATGTGSGATEHRPLKLLRIKEVEERTGLSNSTIYNKLNEDSPYHDPTFPTQEQTGGNSVRWREDKIEAWIASCQEGGNNRNPNAGEVDSQAA